MLDAELSKNCIAEVTLASDDVHLGRCHLKANEVVQAFATAFDFGVDCGLGIRHL